MKFVERARRTEAVLNHGFRWEQTRLGLHTLVSEIGSVRLVKVEWQVLDPDLQSSGHALDSLKSFLETYNASVQWDGVSDIHHDSDHHVLLEIESLRVRVETPFVAEGGELPGREDRFQEFTSREGEQLSDIGRNIDTRLTNIEELVDEHSVNRRSVNVCRRRVCLVLVMIDIPDRDEDRSDEPSSEGARGHCRIIMIVNHSTNFGVWRVLVK